MKSDLTVFELLLCGQFNCEIVLKTVFVSPRIVLFGNKRSGTVSDVINYYKFEMTI